MAYISRQDKDKILAAARIEDVASNFLTNPVHRKDDIWYCCPLHNERTPSFEVSPRRNTWHCFGCGKGGDAISFLMEIENMPYIDAMKWLANRFGVPIDLHEGEENDDVLRKEAEFRKLTDINARAAKFYAQALAKAINEGGKAADYVRARGWDNDIARDFCIGLASGGKSVCAYLKAQGIAEEDIIAAGLGVADEKALTGLRDAFFNRIMFPVHDRYGHVLGFTGRSMEADPKIKYVNTRGTAIFTKGDQLYGLHQAQRRAREQKMMYVVEGVPDVLAVQSAGIANVVAPLGTALTASHIRNLKIVAPSVCFIPDNDAKKGKEIPAGNKAVLEHGMECIRQGLQVMVKELPKEKPTDKVDADSFITGGGNLDDIDAVDFAIWGTRIVSAHNGETIKGRKHTADWAGALIALIKDDAERALTQQAVAKELGVSPALFGRKIQEMTPAADTSEEEDAKLTTEQKVEKYGFAVSKTGYVGFDRKGKEIIKWSNFTLEPLLHVLGYNEAKRLYRLTNDRGESCVVELKQDEITYVKPFMLRTESLGNYIFFGSQDNLNAIKSRLYQRTETAREITQMGWNAKGFYAWGNGITYQGQWHPADDCGIVRLDNGSWYLPATSLIYAEEPKLFEYERKFIYRPGAPDVTMRKVCDTMRNAWGDAAIVGICYMMSSIFRDIVMDCYNNFPSLNLFGPKGTGKSEFGFALMAFFCPNLKATNLSGGTFPALSKAIARCSDALVFLDEYKNSLPVERMDILKGLYNGMGREKMNMDKDKKVEASAVDSGVIIAGQEMPTIDIALFSRMIYLTFTQTTRTPEEMQRIEPWLELKKRGLTHLTVEILGQRDRVLKGFRNAYDMTIADLQKAAKGSGVEDRILRSWTTILAVYRTLEGVIETGFTYKECLTIFADMMKAQNAECRSSNEMAGFWNALDTLRQNGDIYMHQDYRIEPATTFKTPKGVIEFNGAVRLLYLSLKRPMMVYRKAARATGETIIPSDALTYYLEHSPECLGRCRKRFKNRLNNEDVAASSGAQTPSRVDNAYVFNYDLLEEHYDINLEESMTYYNSETAQSTEDNTVPTPMGDDDKPF